MRFISAILFALQALVVCAVGATAEPLPRSVLILNQSTPFGPWPNAIIAAVRSTMNDRAAEPVTFYLEHLDLFRFKGQPYANSLENHFREKYRGKPIGVVVAIGPVALDYALNLRAALWPSVPVVFAAVEDTRAAQGIPSNVTGVTMHQTLDSMIRAARIVVPALKGFAIVGNRLEDQIYYRNFASDLPKISRDLQFIDLMGLSIEETRQRVSALPEHTAILYIGINFYGPTTYVAAETVPLIAERANRPIIVDTETFFGSGAIGGFMLSPQQIGQDAGRLALRIIQGADVSGISITTGGGPKPIFDWRQLQRWNVREDQLPAGAEVRFRSRSLWQQYQTQILLILAAIVVQAALICWLVYEHWRRQFAEGQTSKLMSEISHANRVATVGQLSASIAHEMRQPLTAISAAGSAGLNWLEKRVPNLEEAKSAMELVIREVQRADDLIKNTRAMFRRESDPKKMVNVNELVQQVLALAARTIQSKNVILQLELSNVPPPLVLVDAIQLQQVFLNLIMNAIEAMERVEQGGRTLRLQTRIEQSQTVVIAVEDFGPGIDPKLVNDIFAPFFTTKPGGMGMGLAICKSIVESHKGHLTATRGEHRGTIFQVSLPLAQAG